ncbi:Malate dehydrogenase [Tolypocladium capitatum]|uniref:Malate dehydrogenase n=1 Tax=Tolypocladium capitatum TaxID=45235 RepID=A0A2K3QA57_9HYPO|nr:Malate dehydrogenase [Tolypocladium capitatum]
MSGATGQPRANLRVKAPGPDGSPTLSFANTFSSFSLSLSLPPPLVQMRPSTVLASTLAMTARAAPTFPELNLKGLADPAGALDSLSAYFSLMADKVQAARLLSAAPVCDVSRAQMPAGVDGLPPPAEGLTLRHVAVGRGTQNYTCRTGKEDAAPLAVGAVATLFNATCIAALYPDLLGRIPSMAVHFNLSDAERLGPSAMPRSGVHYFADSSTPFFDLDTPALGIGRAPCAKNGTADAPSTAAVGQRGDKAVAWLRLTAKQGATNGIREVYRVTTAGGSPPPTCRGLPAEFEVQYAAVYWFWQGADSG